MRKSNLLRKVDENVKSWKVTCRPKIWIFVSVFLCIIRLPKCVNGRGMDETNTEICKKSINQSMLLFPL